MTENTDVANTYLYSTLINTQPDNTLRGSIQSAKRADNNGNYTRTTRHTQLSWPHNRGFRPPRSLLRVIAVRVRFLGAQRRDKPSHSVIHARWPTRGRELQLLAYLRKTRCWRADTAGTDADCRLGQPRRSAARDGGCSATRSGAMLNRTADGGDSPTVRAEAEDGKRRRLSVSLRTG